MNILRIVYDWPEPWVGLAPGPYFLSRAQGILGHFVTVLTGGLGGGRIFRLRFREKPEENVVVWHLPRALSKYTGPFLTTSPTALLFYLVRRIFLRNIDIVHGHGHTMLCFEIYKWLFGKLDKISYVKHYHISSKDRARYAKERGEKFKFFQRFWEIPLHNLSDKLGVKVANACIFPSQTTRQQFVEYYNPDPSKLFVVENGVPTHLFYPARNQQVFTTKEILFVGVLSPRKGFNLLIEALKYLPAEYELRWIGTVQEESYKKEVEELAQNLGLEHRVTFQGEVPNLELRPYYQKASIFALSSQSEGLPKVVVESLACGTPVIASGFKMQEKILGMNYFSSLTPKNIAKEIQVVVEENQKVDVKRIRTYFSWEAKAREIDKIYKKLK